MGLDALAHNEVLYVNTVDEGCEEYPMLESQLIVKSLAEETA